MAIRSILSQHKKWNKRSCIHADFCVKALNEAVAKYGKPEIMNSDQGSQFTSFEWIQALRDTNVEISMDGKVGQVDNQMIERLWRSLKYECVYINTFRLDHGPAQGQEDGWHTTILNGHIRPTEY